MKDCSSNVLGGRNWGPVPLKFKVCSQDCNLVAVNTAVCRSSYLYIGVAITIVRS